MFPGKGYKGMKQANKPKSKELQAFMEGSCMQEPWRQPIMLPEQQAFRTKVD